MRGCDAVRAIVPRCEAQGLRYSSDEIPTRPSDAGRSGRRHAAQPVPDRQARRPHARCACTQLRAPHRRARVVPRQCARPHHRRLHDARDGRAGIHPPHPRLPRPRRPAHPDGHRQPRARRALRGTRLRRERLPHQAGRCARIRSARAQHAQAAPGPPRQRAPRRDPRRRGAPGNRRHPRPRARDHHPAVACGRVPRSRDRRPHPAHVALFGPDRPPPGPGRRLRRDPADGRTDARRGQARHPRYHPAQARPTDGGRVRGDEAPPADRPRHPQGLVVQHPAPGRNHRPHPPREVRWQRLPAGTLRPVDPDGGPHRRGRRRVRCAHLRTALQAGMADVAGDRAAARGARQPLRPTCVDALFHTWEDVLAVQSRYQDEHAPEPPVSPPC